MKILFPVVIVVWVASVAASAQDGLEAFIHEAREVCIEEYKPDTYGICTLEKFRPYATDFYRLQQGEDVTKYRFDRTSGITARAVTIACGKVTGKKDGRIDVHAAISCIEQKVNEVKERIEKRRAMSADDWFMKEVASLYGRSISLWCPDPLVSKAICSGFIAQRHYSPCARKYIDEDRLWIDSDALWSCITADFVRHATTKAGDDL